LNEVRNLSDMVTSFLNFARPQPLHLEEVSLAELISECATELLPLFQERNVELVISDTPERVGGREPLMIGADERMLRQAILNLMRNAAEAIPEENSERLVYVRTVRERDETGKWWALIEIKDTGAGIPPSQLQKIFIPFFTTKTQGHGVGLALAHRVVTEHGGMLTAANSIEGGALFTIRLPQESLRADG
jgi:signal transduction histidine kinase